MRLPAQNIIATIFCSLALFFLGINSYMWLSDILVPPVDGAIFDVTRLTSPFEQSLPFACICAAFPVVCLLLWTKVPVTGISKRIASGILIAASIAGAVMIRRQFFRSELNDLAKQAEEYKINSQVTSAFDNLNMEYWMIVGLLAGCALTFLFFRKKQKNGHRSRKTYKKI